MTIVVNLNTASAARDYAWLQASVANWLHRTDLGSVIPDFVMLAEKRINDDLEARLQDSSAMLEAAAGDRDAGLPADLLSIRLLQVADNRSLDYLAPTAFGARYAASSSGMPRHYTLIGRTARLGPTPDTGYTLELQYRGGVPALADSGGTNWLIEQHADVYLAATMVEALLYIKDAAAGQTWNARYETAMAGLNSTDWAAADALAVRTDTPTP